MEEHDYSLLNGDMLKEKESSHLWGEAANKTQFHVNHAPIEGCNEEFVLWAVDVVDQLRLIKREERIRK